MSMSLQKLAAKRMKFLNGIDANEGDINLDIFEDFYPDQAHFVFELLQNAEDADATEATFTLNRGGCFFEHNGARRFTEGDVQSITGISNSKKIKETDKIGKFGIGFKSVYVYTSTPTIHSGEFSFQISRFVCPEPIDPDETIGAKTRFWLPFNNPKKPCEDAYAEIESRLNELAETTLLFLDHLKSIQWQIGPEKNGEVLRKQHSDNHFEIRKKIDGETATSSHYLKFDQPVLGLEKQRVAIAYALDFLPKVQSFDSSKPLSKQLKIVTADQGRVAVFFPAEKEVSGLRFHLHAPFVTELSRASITDSPANKPLCQQLATLAAASLPDIRNLRLLSPEFLGVLPNPQDLLPARYRCIRSAIVDAMNTEPLTPTHSKSHAPAKHLLQAKASLKGLLSKDDLEFLVSGYEESPQWAISAAQKNSAADRFLAALAITDWDIDEFVELLKEKASENLWQGIDDKFMAWLAKKSTEWHQQFYALLYKELEPEGGLHRLKNISIIRLKDGSYSVGSKCYFPSEDADQGAVRPLVDIGVYTLGKNKTDQKNARKFLEKIGVGEVDEAEQVKAILELCYGYRRLEPKKEDLTRFIALVESNPVKAGLFEEYFVFESNGGEWRRPSDIFLDQPFMDTGLSAYYGALGNDAERFALAESYQSCDVSTKRLTKFAKAVGAETRLTISPVSCTSNPQWPDLKAVGGSRNASPINQDFVIAGLENVLKAPSLKLSKLIWRTMSSLTSGGRYLTAIYRRNVRSGARQVDSQLVHKLRQAEWVPQADESFVRPAEADRDLLPEGFPFDTGSEWLKAIHFGEEIAKKSDQYRAKVAAAKTMGFPDEQALKDAQSFAKLSPERRREILQDSDRRQQAELPERDPTNPERRAELVGEQADDAPGREAEKRTRSVSVSREAVKAEAAQYLGLQYKNTNNDGEMICQVCMRRLPFELDDGTRYFEKGNYSTRLDH